MKGLTRFTMTTAQDEQTTLALIAQELKYVTKSVDRVDKKIDEVKHTLENQYVTKTEFEPYKKLIAGLVFLVLTAVVGAMVGMVLQ